MNLESLALAVKATPEGSFLDASDLASALRVSRTEAWASLSAFAADASFPLVEAAPGLWWRCGFWPRGKTRPRITDVAYRLAGPGSGPAGLSASNALRLTKQVSLRSVVAVLGRSPQPLPGVEWIVRTNRARAGLTREEVGVIEAALDAPFWDVSAADGTAVLAAAVDRLAAAGAVRHELLAPALAGEPEGAASIVRAALCLPSTTL